MRGLRSLAKTKKGQAISGKTRNNYRNAVVELFNYAKKNGYLPKDLGTEAQTTSRVKEVKKDNEIFVSPKITDLLHLSPVHLVPSMATKAFSGVRTEEVARMGFEDISLKKGYVILPRKITKSNKRRIFRIPPNLRKWLEPFEGLKGPICWRWSTSQSVFQAWDKAARKLGIRAGANRFRNSFISYRVAQTGDIKKTAKESGNSERDIEDNYLELATEEEAAAWFSIEPSPERLKELHALAAELTLTSQLIRLRNPIRPVSFCHTFSIFRFVRLRTNLNCQPVVRREQCVYEQERNREQVAASNIS